jgi:hypothetical protein
MRCHTLGENIYLPKRLADALEAGGLDIIDVIIYALGDKLDPHETAEARIELAERYLAEAKEYISKCDAVQASEKLYKVTEECIKALAEILKLPEASEARRNGRWFTWLLGSAPVSIAEKLGKPEVAEAWALAYDAHVWGFHEMKYSIDKVAWRFKYVETLLEIAKNVIKCSQSV